MIDKIQKEFKNEEVQKNIIKIVIIIAILAFLSFVLWRPLRTVLSNMEEFRAFILSFGLLGPVIFILIASLQVLISPLPGQVMGIFSGYTFGWFAGTIYGMTGTLIGTFIAFVLSRRFGRPLVEKVVDKKLLGKFDNLSNERGSVALFMIYLLPFLPDDTICFVAGLTKIPIRRLMVIALVGRLPGALALNIIGSGIFLAELTWTTWLFGVLLSVAIIAAYLNKDRLEENMMKIVEKSMRK